MKLMPGRSTVLTAILATVVALGFAGVGCKQGLGDRCQVREDCDPPLICNMATQSCANTAGGDIDASVPDAPLD